MVRSIKQAEEILKIISENVSDLVIVTDIKRKLISSNSAYEKLFGGPEVFAGTDFINHVHVDDRETVKSNFQEAITVGYSGTFSFHLSVPGHPMRMLQSRIFRILDERDNPRNLIVISRDMTDIVQSQKEIHLLAQAVDCTKDAFLLTDPGGKFLFVNSAACAMYGYSEEEMSGQKIDVIYSPSSSAEVINKIREAGESGGWNAQILNRRKDGSEFFAEFWTSAIKGDNKETVARVTVVRDIDESKRTQERLRQTMERFRLTLDNLNIVAFELDSEGKFLLARGKGLNKMGFGPDEIVGTSVFSLSEKKADVLPAIRAAYKGEAQEIDLDIRGVLWNVNFIPLKNPDGLVERVFGTAIDITERHLAEETLLSETKLWNTLMDNIPDTIYFKDIQSRFLRINKAQYKVFGIPENEDVTGKTDEDFFTPDHARKTYSDEQGIVSTGIPLIGLVEKVTTKVGGRYWFSTTKIPVRDKDDKITGIIGSSRDITEIKQAEELESALYRIAEETASAKDLPQLYLVIHQIISELMYAKNFFIALYDNKNDLLTFPYFVDEVDTPPPPGTAGHGLTAYVLRSGRSMLCDQKMSDDLEKAGEAELVGVPCPIWLGVPLVSEGETIGAVVVQHYSDPGAYTEREQHILEFVSTQIAKAIERKQAAEALKKSDERYRAFVSQSSGGIWRFESETPIVSSLPENEQIELIFGRMYIAECNDAFARRYGLSRADEMIGKRFAEILPPGDPRNTAIIRNFLKGGYKIVDAETEEIDKKGNLRIFQNNFIGIVEDRCLRRIWCTQSEITGNRQSENLLRQSEEKYRKLFEDSLDCIILSTPEGKLTDINPAGVRLFGYSSREELLRVGNASELYFKPEDRDSFTNHLERYGYIKDLEIAIKRKDGQKGIALENSSIVHDLEGKILGYRSFLRDITERKNLEEQLRQAQKMESIGTLAGGIAHEFNNLLGIIQGYASILENRSLDANRISQGVETIKKAVQRGAGLVRQLLTFARKGETSFDSIDVNETVAELIEIVRQTFPKTIAIKSRLADTVLPVIADSSQIHVALLNLCVNSRDAIIEDKLKGSGSGIIEIETGISAKEDIQSRFPNAKADKYVFIHVKDTGTGMDDDTRSRIFEPFFTTKELGKGTGLGLAVVYGIIVSHNGLIEVESEKGSGTTFTLYFPVTDALPQYGPGTGKDSSPGESGNETILIVEDEEMLAALLKSLLEDQGYHVLVAKDGQEGLEIYQKQADKVDIVLSDMGLPRLGGYEMFMKMKESNPKIKAILASGYFDPQLKLDLVNAGAKDFIQKPYVPEIIMRRIREVLDGK